MPGKPPPNFPAERRLLTDLGERLRLARKRRNFSTAVVAARAGISRTTLYHIERGDPSVTFGSFLRVLTVLGLEKDITDLAVDDPLGRRLQDLKLEPARQP